MRGAAGVTSGIEHLDAIVRFIRSQKDERRAIFQDENGGKDEGRDIDEIPLNGLCFEPSSPCGAVIE